MISSSQIRAGRSLLGWSALELAEKSGVGVASVRRYETQEGVPSANAKTLHALRGAMESEGVEFLGDPIVNPGVMLHLK